MPDYFVNTYGDYVYGNGADLTAANSLASIEETLAMRGQTATRAGRGGRYSAGSLYDALLYTLSGLIVAPDVTDPGVIRGAWRAFKAAHLPGQTRRMVLDSDCYANMEVSSEVKASAWGGEPYRAYSVTLASYEDPPVWAATPTTQALALGSNALTSPGTGSAEPVLTITVDGIAAGGQVRLTDSAGNFCAFSPDVTGAYILDTVQETLTYQDGSDKMAVFEPSGDFLHLAPGENTWTLAVSGGASVSAASVTWQDRWY